MFPSSLGANLGWQLGSVLYRQSGRPEPELSWSVGNIPATHQHVTGHHPPHYIYISTPFCLIYLHACFLLREVDISLDCILSEFQDIRTRLFDICVYLRKKCFDSHDLRFNNGEDCPCLEEQRSSAESQAHISNIGGFRFPKLKISIRHYRLYDYDHNV